jgi:hypothetical protein
MKYLLFFLIPTALFGKTLPSSERFFESSLFPLWWEQIVAKDEVDQSPTLRRRAYLGHLFTLKKSPNDAYIFYTTAKLWDDLTAHYLHSYPNTLDDSARVDAALFTKLLGECYPLTCDLQEYEGPKDGKKVDGITSGSIPYFLFDWNRTKILRFPNICDCKNKAREDFILFLNALEQKNETLLYINVMSGLSGEDEQEKISQIHSLENGTITVLTLDKNSDFYLQKGIWRDNNDAKQFKKELVKRVLSKTITNRWPKKLEITVWEPKLLSLVDEIHKTYFNQLNDLKYQERADFIEIFYIDLISLLLDDFKPDYANISCKNTIDRGPSLLALLYLKQRCLYGEGFFGKDMNKLLSLVLFQPILLRNRPAHQIRIDRLTSSGQRILLHLQNSP